MARFVEYSNGKIGRKKRARKACLDNTEKLYKEIGHLPTRDEWQRRESRVGFTLDTVEDIFGSFENMIDELSKRPEVSKREEERIEMGRPPKWTQEDLLDALYRACIDTCGNVDPPFITQSQYDSWSRNASSEEPRAITISHRFDSWEDAITAMQEQYAPSEDGGHQEEISTLEPTMNELGESTSPASEPEPESEPPDLAPDYWDLEFEMPSQANALVSEEQDSSIESEPDSNPAPVVEPELGTHVDVDPEPSNSEQEASGFTPMVYRVANLSSYDCRLGHTVLEPSDWSIVVEQSVTYTMTPLDKTKKDEGRKSGVNDAYNRNIVPIGEYEKVIEWKLTLKDSMGHEVKWSELDSDVFYLVDAKIYGLLPQENRPANMVPVYQTLYSGSYPPGLYVCVE